MTNPKIKITENEILSDNWYTLRKISYEYQKKTATLKSKRVKPMIAETAPSFCSTTKRIRPLYSRDNFGCPPTSMAMKQE